jgi:hypothetical protein
MSKKAQIISIDLIISVIIFIILISFVFLTISRYQTSINENIASQDINVKALQISDLLVKSSGEPSNWEDDVSKLNTIGLASRDRSLHISKITEFLELDYNLTKEKFNVETFDFYFALKELNGALVEIDDDNIEKGLSAGLNATNVVTIKRIVLYGGNEKRVEFTLWK